MERILGIDLGTSNSSAAIVKEGRPVTVPSLETPPVGGKAFPSVVAFLDEGEILVGELARRQASVNPHHTITAFKRKMGTDHVYNIEGRQYTPVQISALLLEKIKHDAEVFLGIPVEKAVITVPAYFNDRQRTATKEAGELAGLEVVRIINEPTAACLAYGMDKKGQHRILIFDLGGGTFDVTILEFGNGIFEVKATSGDTQLGGTDMDNALMNYVTERFLQQTSVNLVGNVLATARVREAVEKAKIELSTAIHARITVPFVAEKNSEALNLDIELSRGELEEIVKPIIERCREPMMRAIVDSKIKPSDIDHVIMVGGPTRMPIVQRFMEDIMGKKPEVGIDPMEVVALGVSIQGAVLAGEMKELLLLDVTPLSLGIETFGGLMNVIIPRNTTIPTKAGEVFTTAVDNQRNILIHILQGEREMAGDNFSLGKFTIEVDSAPAGATRVGVQFTLDENGILHVLARDLKTGREKTVTIKSTVDVSSEAVEKMVQESVEHALEDMKNRQLVEAKISAQQAITATAKALEQYGAQLSQDEISSVDRGVKQVVDALDINDVDKIKAAVERLDKATSRLANLMFEDAARKLVEEQRNKREE